MSYDLVVAGGGICGASLALRMAKNGARVLVVERETEFRDRIRGEAMQPWGSGEVRRLGIAEILRGCSNEMRWFLQIINGQHAMKRDMVSTTPQAAGLWGFYHPRAQEELLSVAAAAGAEVRRGTTVQHITPGATPKVRITHGAEDTEVAARLVAVCLGRNPALRSELGFRAQRGSIPLFLSGVLLTNLSAEVDAAVGYVANDVSNGAVAALFPQTNGHARAYFGFHPQKCLRLQGDADFPRFCQEFNKAAGGAIPFGEPQPAGPLASFECVDVWVEYPYRDGVALLGDSAASNDPSWGQGLSLSFRDARILSDELLAGEDWNAAGHSYATRHDDHYGIVSKVSGWFYDVFQRLGPEAEARRTRVLPMFGQDPTRLPDTLFSGPDMPLAADARVRFFGEDLVSGANPTLAPSS